VHGDPFLDLLQKGSEPCGTCSASFSLFPPLPWRLAAFRRAPATQAGSPPTAAKRAATMPDHADKDKEIVIDNFTFDPPEVTIPIGTRVTWVNHDDVPHTATSTTKPRAFDSGTLDTDQKYSFTFASAGVYEYFCAVHPKMTGRITVK
jgi:plastocyanin